MAEIAPVLGFDGGPYLEEAIMRYLENSNADPKPFIWTKTADEILATIARFYKRISNSGTSAIWPSRPALLTCRE